MTERPYTEGDLRHEAARQHATLIEDPDFMGIGEMMNGQVIPSTTLDLTGVIGEPYELCQGWHQISPENFEEAQRLIGDLLQKAANVSGYAIDCGAEGLRPAGHRTVNGDEDGPTRAAFHIALDPQLELDPRAYDEIADVIRTRLSFQGES